MRPDEPTFTRRRILGGAAAAAGAGLLAVPAAAAAREDFAAGVRDGSAGAVFTRRLTRLSGTSPVIVTGQRFVLAGVQWAGAPTAAIELRARLAGGRWSRWATASVRGHGPDRTASAAVHSGEPVWFGPADELQVRSAVPVSGVRVQFVAASAVAPRLTEAPRTGAAPAAALPRAEPVLAAGGGQPHIIARSAWAGRGHKPSAGPYYGAVEMAFVHHSDGPNAYSRGEVPAMLRSIYLFHRHSNGWWDIGYNFVIDAFGRIWEARAGGIDLPVIGAQAGGYNAHSTGVCLLGTFSDRLPTPAALHALQRLLAWKLPLHGVPILGKVRVEVDPSAASYTRFRPGQRVWLPRIAGHRDGDATTCPGNDLYGHLPAVRRHVERLAGSATARLTLAASGTNVPPGTRVSIGGTLRRLHGPPIAGAPLELQTVSGVGHEATFATVITAADGSWSAALVPARTTIVRALHRDAPAAVSDVVQIGLVPVITLSLVSSSPLRLAGTVAPAGARRVRLDVYKLSGRHRHRVLARHVPVHDGRFSARLSLGRHARGHYEIVARTPANRITVAGASPPVQLTV